MLLRLRNSVIEILSDYVKNDCKGSDGCIYKRKMYKLTCGESGGLIINGKSSAEYKTEELIGLMNALS
ncbi:MAG: hypothetical protein ACRCVU_05085 [Flavobacterium sp.]